MPQYVKLWLLDVSRLPPGQKQPFVVKFVTKGCSHISTMCAECKPTWEKQFTVGNVEDAAQD